MRGAFKDVPLPQLLKFTNLLSASLQDGSGHVNSVGFIRTATELSFHLLQLKSRCIYDIVNVYAVYFSDFNIAALRLFQDNFRFLYAYTIIK